MSAGPNSARPMSLKRTIRLPFLFQDKVVELFCRMHQPQCADGEFGGISFDTAGGKFHIFLVYGILHIHGGDAVTGHLDGV